MRGIKKAKQQRDIPPVDMDADDGDVIIVPTPPAAPTEYELFQDYVDPTAAPVDVGIQHGPIMFSIGNQHGPDVANASVQYGPAVATVATETDEPNPFRFNLPSDTVSTQMDLAEIGAGNAPILNNCTVTINYYR